MENFIKKMMILLLAIYISYADEIQELKLKIDKLEKENYELRLKIEKLEKIFFKVGDNSGLIETQAVSPPEQPQIKWVEPLMGWEVDYQNNKIYAVDNTGSSYNMNVGIGTDNPLSRFHLVGDFYNQGFVGAKSNFDPGVESWTTVATRTITTHGTGEEGSVVLIFAHVQENTAGGYVDMFIRVRRGTDVVGIACSGGFYDVWSGLSGYMGATLVTFDEPPAGTHTYTLEIESVFGAPYGYQFFVIELKR